MIQHKIGIDHAEVYFYVSMRIILRKTVNTVENSALKLANLPSSKVIRLIQPSVHVKFEEFVALHVSSFFFNKSTSNLPILLYIFRRLSVQWCPQLLM